jgi:small subunit ribosomal protein S8
MRSTAITSTDPIADMLSRIRNAIAVNKHEIDLPHSNVKERVAKILASNGFIEDAKQIKDEQGRKRLQIQITPEGTNSPITEIARVSTPGRRLYVKSSAIPLIKRGRGIVVISTSKGMMTGEEARSKRLGGELICKIY